jgi:hypothetical protein
MEKKANHRAVVVRLGAAHVHPNADTLELLDIPNTTYQVVVKKGEFKAGDLGVYIVPDSVIPQTPPFAFIWEAHVGLDGTVPEKRRRITVKRFRGEWSEGLLLPVTDFNVLYAEVGQLYPGIVEGADVSERLGITHYDPDAGKETSADNETFKKAKRWPRSLKGWFYYILHFLRIRTRGTNDYGTEEGVDMPVYDVEALKNYKDAFEPNEQVEVTEKIHGSNARFVFRDEHMYAGSRTQWKAVNAKCIWRDVLKSQPWIEEWCRAYLGYGLYGEVTPSQGSNFQYGSSEPQLFAFDIRTPDGAWMHAAARNELTALFNIQKVKWVPILYTGAFKDIPWELVDGQTAVPGAKGLREGIVIRPVNERYVRGLGRLILKVVSNKFLEKDVAYGKENQTINRSAI